MFLDGRDGSLPSDPAYDVVVIGAGPAGIALSRELTAAGLSVGLLESGGLEFDDATQALYDAEHAGNTETDLTAGRLRYLGGTTNHWGGHCLPLDRIDIERAPLNGMSGWPIAYEDLLAVYPRAHAYCDLGPFAYDHREILDIPEERFLMADDPAIETVAFRQSPPTRFGPKYRDWLGSAEGPDTWLWTNAVDLEADGDGRVTAVLTRTLDGLERRLAGRAVAIACGAVETARLLLHSNAENARRFGDGGGMLGRCYLDHPSGGAAILTFSRPVSEKVYWMDDKAFIDGAPVRFMMRLADDVIRREELNNAHFFLLPIAETREERQRARAARDGLSALKSIAKWTIGYDDNPSFSLSREYCTFITNADALAERQIARLTGDEGVERVLLKYETEQLPDPASRVELTERRDALGLPVVRLTWEPSERDLASVKRSAVLIGEAAGRAGLGRLKLEDHDDKPYWGSETAWHQLGTTRMAAREADGVVDRDCRVFGTKNLYVASGGAMPTSGRANPTLTIVALAVRLADHLKGEIAG